MVFFFFLQCYNIVYILLEEIEWKINGNKLEVVLTNALPSELGKLLMGHIKIQISSQALLVAYSGGFEKSAQFVL